MKNKIKGEKEEIRMSIKISINWSIFQDIQIENNRIPERKNKEKKITKFFKSQDIKTNVTK